LLIDEFEGLVNHEYGGYKIIEEEAKEIVARDYKEEDFSHLEGKLTRKCLLQ